MKPHTTLKSLQVPLRINPNQKEGVYVIDCASCNKHVERQSEYTSKRSLGQKWKSEQVDGFLDQTERDNHKAKCEDLP